MRYLALSFDLDGTLVDTATEIAGAANRTLEDFALPRQHRGGKRAQRGRRSLGHAARLRRR